MVERNDIPELLEIKNLSEQLLKRFEEYGSSFSDLFGHDEDLSRVYTDLQVALGLRERED